MNISRRTGMTIRDQSLRQIRTRVESYWSSDGNVDAKEADVWRQYSVFTQLVPPLVS